MKVNGVNGVKRTQWARRHRDVLDTFTGCRVSGVQLDRIKAVCETLNVDVSDLLRAVILAIALLPRKDAEIGQNLDEIKSAEKVNPPTTSDKIRYV